MSSAYHPETDGQTEVADKSILSIIRAKLQARALPRQWASLRGTSINSDREIQLIGGRENVIADALSIMFRNPEVLLSRSDSNQNRSSRAP